MTTPFIDVRDEFADVDTFYVANQDEKFYYCWVNKKPENVERRKLEGYETVTSKDGDNALTRPNAANERVIGDVILMRMPRERYERIVARRRAVNKDMLDSANDTAKEQMQKAGFETIDETKVSKVTGVFDKA